MLRKPMVLSLALLLSLAVFGRTPQVTAGAAGDDEQAVRQIEDQVATALDHNDADALDRLWASDYMFVNPSGTVFTKAERLASLRSGDLKYQSYSRDEENIRIFGSTAVVIYRSTISGQKAGKDISSRRRVTTVLLKRDGRWQVVSQQTTVILGQ